MGTRKQKTEARKASRNTWGDAPRSTPLAELRQFHEDTKQHSISFSDYHKLMSQEYLTQLPDGKWKLRDDISNALKLRDDIFDAAREDANEIFISSLIWPTE